MLDVSDALFHTAHDFKGGVPALAQRMDASANVLQKKVDPAIDTHKPLLLEAVKIQQITQDYRVLHAMAQTLEHVAIPVPAEIELGDMGLLDAFMRTVEADGALCAEFRKAWADGNINAKEFEQLKISTYKQIGERLAFLAEIERVVR